MKIAFVIPNYNGESILKKNLPHVIAAAEYSKEHAKVPVEIVIIDDHSEDSSVSVIKSFEQRSEIKIMLQKNEKNLGFSSTVNKGVRLTDAELIVLLNTDVKPEKDFLLPLLDHFSDDSIFAVGCMDKSIENERTVLRGRGIGWWKRGFLHHAAGDLEKESTLWVSGGSSIFRKSIWEKLEGMNELYNPFYWEDIDLSYRAQKKGFNVLFESKSIVVHEHEKGAIKSKYSPDQVKEVAYRNQILFAWNNITDTQLLLQHIAWLPYHIVSAITKGDLLFLSGLTKAFLLLPKVIAYRRNHANQLVRKDKEIEIYS